MDLVEQLLLPSSVSPTIYFWFNMMPETALVDSLMVLVEPPCGVVVEMDRALEVVCII
jgi:hypothetical protein